MDTFDADVQFELFAVYMQAVDKSALNRQIGYLKESVFELD